MAGLKEYQGLGSSEATVRIVPQAKPTEAKLSVTEGFVLSRVDGHSTVQSLCFVSGLGEEATVGILRRLKELGLILIEKGGATTTSGRFRAATPTGTRASVKPPSEELHTSSRQRSVTGPIPVPESSRSSTAGDKQQSQNSRPATPPRSTPATGTSAAVGARLRSDTPAEYHTAFFGEAEWARATAIVEADPPGIELKREFCITLRALFHKLGELSFYELLAVEATIDAALLRRAYFKLSKVYHPDRYFNKKLGPYKEMLQEIFKQISGAYKSLEDQQQREDYYQMIQQELEQESLARAVEAQGAEALREAEQELESGTDVEKEPVTNPELDLNTFMEKELAKKSPSSEYSFNKAAIQERVGPTGHREVIPTLNKQRSDTASYNRIIPKIPAPPSSAKPPPPQQIAPSTRRRRKTLSTPDAGRLMRARAFFEQGKKQLADGQVQAAAASLKLAMNFNPAEPDYSKLYHQIVERSQQTTAENYFRRATLEERAGRKEAASRLFIKAAELSSETRFFLKAAEYVLEVGDLIKAKDYARKAVQRDAKSVEARVYLARALNGAGQVGEARQELERALKLDPTHAQAKQLLKQLRMS